MTIATGEEFTKKIDFFKFNFKVLFYKMQCLVLLMPESLCSFEDHDVVEKQVWKLELFKKKKLLR